jgi:hypothetical protein
VTWAACGGEGGSRAEAGGRAVVVEGSLGGAAAKAGRWTACEAPVGNELEVSVPVENLTGSIQSRPKR